MIILRHSLYSLFLLQQSSDDAVALGNLYDLCQYWQDIFCIFKSTSGNMYLTHCVKPQAM